MPPQVKPVDPCKSLNGHNIQSLRKGLIEIRFGPSKEPRLVDDLWVGCVKCGRTLNEIRAVMPDSWKEKKANGEDAPT